MLFWKFMNFSGQLLRETPANAGFCNCHWKMFRPKYIFQKISHSIFLIYVLIFNGMCSQGLSVYLYFPAPGSFAWPPPLALVPNLYLPFLVPDLYLPALAPNLCLPALAPHLYLTALASNMCLPALAPNLCFAALGPNLFLLALASNLLFTSSGQDFTTTTTAPCTITTITTTTTTTTTASTTRDNNNKRCLRGSKIHIKWPLKDI